MPRSTRDIIAELVSKFEPVVQNAFLAAVDEIRNSVILKEVVTRLEKGDINGAIDALHIDREAFARLELAIAEAYNSGGQATVQNLPRLTDPQGNRVRFLFGVRNTPGEAWLREHSAALITRATEDMKEAVRVVLTEGLMRGQNPTKTALQVTGKHNRATNRREGGILGLTTPQSAYVASAREELASGDPERLRNYLKRVKRTKGPYRSFDKAVLKAIREEKPVPAETIDRMVAGYADRLLALRGQMIAQNETQTAIAQAQKDGIQQQIDAGKLYAAEVEKVWRHTPQERGRVNHIAMNGKAMPWGEQFELPNGIRMDFPHSPDAPASELLGCKCVWTSRVNYTAVGLRKYRQRVGEAA